MWSRPALREISVSVWIARAYARGLLPTEPTRGIFWRLAGRSKRIKSVVVTVPVTFPGGSLTLRLPLSNRLNWLMLFKGVSSSEDAEMLKAFCQHAREATFVLDIGVNSGLYIYHAATVCRPDTMIVGIEPNADLVASVNANLVANGRHNAVVRHAAATDHAGVIRFYLGSEDQVASVDSSHVAEFGDILECVEVPAIPIDDVVDECGRCPNLIKLDVEGHELVALRGMVRVLARCSPTLLVEVKAANVAAVDALMVAHGYRGRRWHNDRILVSDLDPGDESHANYLYEPSGA